jgi:hypothetical protein
MMLQDEVKVQSGQVDLQSLVCCHAPSVIHDPQKIQACQASKWHPLNKKDPSSSSTAKKYDFHYSLRNDGWARELHSSPYPFYFP